MYGIKFETQSTLYMRMAFNRKNKKAEKKLTFDPRSLPFDDDDDWSPCSIDRKKKLRPRDDFRPPVEVRSSTLFPKVSLANLTFFRCLMASWLLLRVPKP